MQLRSIKDSHEKAIHEMLKPLLEQLTIQHAENKDDIRPISLQYKFNENDAWDKLAKEYYQSIRDDTDSSAERGQDVIRFIINNREVFGKDKPDDIQVMLSKEKSGTQYIEFLKRVFEDQYNFQIFKAIRDKHIYDVDQYKIIEVQYGDKYMENASFGQRCAAVIVILILFGNNPLIIDEPETHLDNSLIANYLVSLIKSKKLDRQIIFATHNANFVINGDAEKIFVLEQK